MKMLVVDDNRDICSALKFFFEESGANVETFESADQLLGTKTATGLSEFDVVLTDFQMPGTDGAQLARHLRQLRRDTKIIVMSGPRIESRLTSVLSLVSFRSRSA